MNINFKNIALALVIISLMIATICAVDTYEFFQQSDPKIDFLKNKVEPLFTSDNYFTGYLEPLNNRDILDEIKVYKGNKSYTINKRKVYLCLKDENDEYYSDNMLMYVFLHELSHVICEETGHTQLFHNIFQELLDYAVEEGVYDDTVPIVQDYCEY